MEHIELEEKNLIMFLRHGTSEETNLSAAIIAAAGKYPFRKLFKFKAKMTHCPFHDDRNPSMALYWNRARCFVCNGWWDTIEFVMERERLDFREAVRHLTTEIRYIVVFRVMPGKGLVYSQKDADRWAKEGENPYRVFPSSYLFLA